MAYCSRMLEPAQLRLLQVVARTGSYSAAARELGYTQPAITYQMRSLEKSAGSVLTVRRGRTMALTPAGELLLAHADKILVAIREAENELAAAAGVPTGKLRLAAFPSSCASLVPQAMVTMRRRNPDVHIELVQVDRPESRDQVRGGEVDLALTYHFGRCVHRTGESEVDGADGGGLVRVPVAVDRMRLILPADHAVAHRNVVGVEELAGATWIIAGSRFHDLLDEAAAPFGFSPKVMRVADDYVTMQSLVAHGLGVALVPNLALTAHRNPRIVPRTLRDWPERHIEVELWPDMLAVDAVRTMIDHLVAAANG
jgi:DNA-binding transcriptional LysR family regulator